MSYEIKIDGTDIKFIAEVGQTVLDAAAKHGIELPYSCRKGACGNCKGHCKALCRSMGRPMRCAQ